MRTTKMLRIGFYTILKKKSLEEIVSVEERMQISDFSYIKGHI